MKDTKKNCLAFVNNSFGRPDISVGQLYESPWGRDCAQFLYEYLKKERFQISTDVFLAEQGWHFLVIVDGRKFSITVESVPVVSVNSMCEWWIIWICEARNLIRFLLRQSDSGTRFRSLCQKLENAVLASPATEKFKWLRLKDYLDFIAGKDISKDSE